MDHVAEAGFHPEHRRPVRGLLAGLGWEGRVLERGEEIPTAEEHYPRHVRANGEWPQNTTLEQYLNDIQDVIRDSRSRFFTGLYQEALQLTIIRRSGDLKGDGGFSYVLVDYRASVGHWMTAFQPENEMGELRGERRSNVRWLQRPG